MKNETPNAANPKFVKEAEQKSRNAREQELDDFQKIMQSEHGRRFVMRLLDITGFQRSSFTGNSTTFFNEGARNIGLIIWGDLQQVPPDLFLRMLQEQREKQNG